AARRIGPGRVGAQRRLSRLRGPSGFAPPHRRSRRSRVTVPPRSNGLVIAGLVLPQTNRHGFRLSQAFTAGTEGDAWRLFVHPRPATFHPLPPVSAGEMNASPHHWHGSRWKYSRAVVGSFFGLSAAGCELSTAGAAAVLRGARC